MARAVGFFGSGVMTAKVDPVGSKLAKVIFEMIVIQLEFIDGCGLPRVSFRKLFVINGGQTDGSLMFCCLHEEDVDGIGFEKSGQC